MPDLRLSPAELTPAEITRAETRHRDLAVDRLPVRWTPLLLREGAGVSRGDLGQRLGITPAAIKGAEWGKTPVDDWPEALVGWCRERLDERRGTEPALKTMPESHPPQPEPLQVTFEAVARLEPVTLEAVLLEADPARYLDVNNAVDVAAETTGLEAWKTIFPESHIGAGMVDQLRVRFERRAYELAIERGHIPDSGTEPDTEPTVRAGDLVAESGCPDDAAYPRLNGLLGRTTNAETRIPNMEVDEARRRLASAAKRARRDAAKRARRTEETEWKARRDAPIETPHWVTAFSPNTNLSAGDLIRWVNLQFMDQPTDTGTDRPPQIDNERGLAQLNGLGRQWYSLGDKIPSSAQATGVRRMAAKAIRAQREWEYGRQFESRWRRAMAASR